MAPPGFHSPLAVFAYSSLQDWICVCEREGTRRLTGTSGSFTLEEQSEDVLCLYFSDCLLY